MINKEFKQMDFSKSFKNLTNNPAQQIADKMQNTVNNNLFNSFFEPIQIEVPIIKSAISDNLRNLVLNPIQNIFEEFQEIFNETLIENIRILGSYEWCYLNIHYLDDTDLMRVPIPKDFNRFLKENEDATVKDIDDFVVKFFTKDIITKLSDDVRLYLSDVDLIKFNKAMVNFRARRYFECALLLSGLIDSQNIKQSLYDIHTGKYLPDENGKFNIDQGWNAFAIVFNNNLTDYFNNTSFKGRGNAKEREKKFNKFIEDSEVNIGDETVLAILHLSLCLLKFFDDSNWMNYPQSKPEVINRHWLMHGMYDYEDVTKSDCVKLLLMLNQITELFYKLRKGEL